MHGDTLYIILLTPGFQKSSANTTVEEAVSVRPLGEKCNHVYIYTYIDRKLSTYCTHQHWLQYLPQLASKQTDRDRQRQREHCTHQHWLQYLPQLARKQTETDRQRERALQSPALAAVSTTTSQQADRQTERERERALHSPALAVVMESTATRQVSSCWNLSHSSCLDSTGVRPSMRIYS